MKEQELIIVRLHENYTRLRSKGWIDDCRFRAKTAATNYRTRDKASHLWVTGWAVKACTYTCGRTHARATARNSTGSEGRLMKPTEPHISLFWINHSATLTIYFRTGSHIAANFFVYELLCALFISALTNTTRTKSFLRIKIIILVKYLVVIVNW